MPDTAAGKPDGHDLLRLILAKVERFEDVTAAIVRSQEREVADREHDVGRERRRRRWSLVVVAVFAAALFALGAVQFRFAQDEQNSDNHRTCVSANASRAAVRESIGRVFVLIAEVSPPDRRAAIDGFRAQVDADLAAHLPARTC